MFSCWGWGGVLIVVIVLSIVEIDGAGIEAVERFKTLLLRVATATRTAHRRHDLIGWQILWRRLAGRHDIGAARRD